MNIKNERGSITIFVLAMCLFATMALVGFMTSNKNKLREQQKQQKLIESQYNEESRIDEFYQKALRNQ